MDNSLMDSSYGGPTSLMSSYNYAQPHQPPRSQVYTPSGHHLQQPSFYSQSDLTDSRCFIVIIIILLTLNVTEYSVVTSYGSLDFGGTRHTEAASLSGGHDKTVIDRIVFTW